MSVDTKARVGGCHFANVAPCRASSTPCPNEINTEGMKGGLIGEERGEEADGGTNPAASRRYNTIIAPASSQTHPPLGRKLLSNCVTFNTHIFYLPPQQKIDFKGLLCALIQMRFLSVEVSASERSELVNPGGNTSQSDDKVLGRGRGVVVA